MNERAHAEKIVRRRERRRKLTMDRSSFPEFQIHFLLIEL